MDTYEENNDLDKAKIACLITAVEYAAAKGIPTSRVELWEDKVVAYYISGCEVFRHRL